MTDKLEEIEAVWAKATPGPWEQWRGHTRVYRGPTDINTRRELRPAIFVCDTGDDLAEVHTEELANAAAIAAAPEHIKWLIAEVRRLRTEVARG